MSTYTAAFDWARRHVQAGRLPTAVVGVATADGVVALDAFGATGSRTATIDDHYRIFSITKPLVGLVAARAVERGLLSALSTLRSALPEFAADDIQLQHLVSHTSGIVEPPLDAPTGLRAPLLAGAIARDFAPGAASRYSSVAFEGIAAMIEHATGADWVAGIAEWAPRIGADGFTLDEAANPHEIPDAAAAGLDPAAFIALRHPGAGLISRAADLLAIGTALLADDGAIVQPATSAMMRRPITGDIPRLEPYPPERGQDWGFTWDLRTRAPGLIDRDAYGHGGWSGTQFWVHPTAGVAWVLMTNQVDRPGVDIDELDNAVVAGV